MGAIAPGAGSKILEFYRKEPNRGRVRILLWMDALKIECIGIM